MIATVTFASGTADGAHWSAFGVYPNGVRPERLELYPAAYAGDGAEMTGVQVLDDLLGERPEVRGHEGNASGVQCTERLDQGTCARPDDRVGAAGGQLFRDGTLDALVLARPADHQRHQAGVEDHLR